MTQEVKAERAKAPPRGTAYRVVPQPDRGGAEFGISWRVGTGERRVKAGEIARDIPAVSVPWLLDRGWIEPVGGDE